MTVRQSINKVIIVNDFFLLYYCRPALRLLCIDSFCVEVCFMNFTKSSEKKCKLILKSTKNLPYIHITKYYSRKYTTNRDPQPRLHICQSIGLS